MFDTFARKIKRLVDCENTQLYHIRLRLHRQYSVVLVSVNDHIESLCFHLERCGEMFCS